MYLKERSSNIRYQQEILLRHRLILLFYSLFFSPLHCLITNGVQTWLTLLKELTNRGSSPAD
jgi:hypothetical protein